MWNSLKLIAKNRNLEFKKFEAFALQNSDKFCIVNGQVSNWHVNKLVKEFEYISN